VRGRASPCIARALRRGAQVKNAVDHTRRAGRHVSVLTLALDGRVQILKCKSAARREDALKRRQGTRHVVPSQPCRARRASLRAPWREDLRCVGSIAGLPAPHPAGGPGLQTQLPNLGCHGPSQQRHAALARRPFLHLLWHACCVTPPTSGTAPGKAALMSRESTTPSARALHRSRASPCSTAQPVTLLI
jgi:hypothetical protein